MAEPLPSFEIPAKLLLQQKIPSVRELVRCDAGMSLRARRQYIGDDGGDVVAATGSVGELYQLGTARRT